MKMTTASAATAASDEAFRAMLTDMPRRRRYDQCDDTCTVDCGQCKGKGRPASA